MKKLKQNIPAVVLIFCLSITNYSGAQVLSPEVFPSTGGYVTGGASTLSFTIGETFTPTLSSGNTRLTQGFQQPEISSVITNLGPSGSLCAGSAFTISFTINSVFNAGNTFTAQLSDASGSFLAPVDIGSVAGIAGGTISCTIPGGTANGAGYRIRVVSNDPVVTGSANGSNIAIGILPSDLWTQKANFGGSARFGEIGFSIGTKGYVGTGYDTSPRKDFWEFNPATNSWTQKADFGGTARVYAVGFSIGTKGYAGTGHDVSNYKIDFWEYDPGSNAWTQKANCSSVGRSGATGFSIGDKGYIGTGHDGSSPRNDFWEYNPVSDSWTQKTNFGGVARSVATGFSIGSKGYIGTGLNGGTGKDFWEYNSSTNSWVQKADFGGAPRSRAAGFSIGSKGYIGTGYGFDANNKSDFWEYNPVTDSWVQKAAFGGGVRLLATGFNIGSKGYLGIGADASNKNDFWQYEPDPSIQTQSPSPSSLCAGSVVSVPFVIGGSFGVCGSNVFTAQLSDASGSFSSPANIGSVTGTTGGTISCTIPGGVPDGAAYRIRVVSNNPVITGTDNGNNIPIAHTPPTLAIHDPAVCSPGTIDLTASAVTSGSTNGLTYSYWTNSTATSALISPSVVAIPGTYYIKGTPSFGCSVTGAVQAIFNSTPDLLTTITQPACFGNTGSVALSVTGGTPPYFYSGDTTAGLYPGSYHYTVIDINGCTSSQTITINAAPLQLNLFMTATQSSCISANGNVSLGAGGGTPPYIFSGDNTVALEAGTYFYTVEDANGCTRSDSVSINLISLNAFPSLQHVCLGGRDTIVLNTSGGSPPYIIVRSDTIDLYRDTTYYYTVTDNHGCQATTSAIIFVDTCIFSAFPLDTIVSDSTILGSALTSLSNNTDTIINDTIPDDNVFQIVNDTIVLMEFIAIDGMHDSLLALLKTPEYGLGDTISNGFNTLIITGYFPIRNLDKLNNLPNLINGCRPYYIPLAGAGNTSSQGGVSMHSNITQTIFSIQGDGVKIGVLSDSYNKLSGDHAHTDVLNDDLPGAANSDNPHPVEVLKEYPFGGGTDEGRAMLQILHDVAPKAKLAFRTGFTTAGDFAEGIKEMQRDSCNIIIDDVTYITEPFFQDGVIARAVDSIAGLGISYFSAAGNYGNKSYQSTFKPFVAGGITAHNFASGSNTDTIQKVTLQFPGQYTIVLQWEDSVYSLGQVPGASTDLDIYLLDKRGKIVTAGTSNNLNGDPIEVLSFNNRGYNAGARIKITRTHGSSNVRLKYIVFRGEITIDNYKTDSSSIVGQANARGAMAVGAVNYNQTPEYGVNPPKISFFSSTGGTPVSGLTRFKPDFTAANGVNTTVNISSSSIVSDSFPFYGTSAAVPHAAGIAALLMEAKKKFSNIVLSPDSVRGILRRTAINMGAPGFDYSSGYGFIQADAALQSFAAPAPFITDLIPLHLPLIDTVKIKGHYISSTSKVIFRGDTLIPLPPILGDSQVKVVFPLFTGSPPVRLYTPPTNPGGHDGGLSNDLYFTKKNVKITADIKTKKYAEQLPVFTSTITVDGVPLQNSGLTLHQLGLDTIRYTTPALPFSNEGYYYIRPSMRTLNLLDSTDASISNSYTFTFKDGLLLNQKMPVRITPKNITLTLGDKLDSIRFSYEYDSTWIATSQRQAVLDSIQISHHANLSENTLALVNGRSIVNFDLTHTSLLASTKSILNGRAIVNDRGILNGILVSDTTHVVDLSDSSFFYYLANSDTTPLVNGRSIVNGRAIIQGRAIVNGRPIIQGRAIVNGSAVLNSSVITDSTLFDEFVIAIIDSSNIYPGDSIVDFKSMNLITGLDTGVHVIVPGAALLSTNFDVSYRLGTLTILPALVTTLNMKIIIEGFYAGYGQMQPRLYIDGMSDDPTACDSITVELHDANSPYDIIESARGLLHTDGSAEILFSPSILTQSFYIAIHSSNGVETWTKDPVLFIYPKLNFDLSGQ